MTSDLDIYRTASVLIRKHGEDAALEAAQRADAMLERGDMEGCATWKRVLKAVEELQRAQATPDEALHLMLLRQTADGPGASPARHGP